MTKTDLIEKLREEDELTLLELLDLSSTEIVDGFLDKVDERYKTIASFYENDE